MEELARKKRRMFAVEKFRQPQVTIVLNKVGWLTGTIVVCEGTYRDYLHFTGERVYYKRGGRFGRKILPILNLLEPTAGTLATDREKVYTLSRAEMFAALGVNDEKEVKHF